MKKVSKFLPLKVAIHQKDLFMERRKNNAEKRPSSNLHGFFYIVIINRDEGLIILTNDSDPLLRDNFI